MEKLLILNPGSTSTKIAVYEDETPLFTRLVPHTPEQLSKFFRVADQYEFRKELVLDALKEKNVDLKTLTAIVARGGMLGPIRAGAYRINEDMVWQLRNKPYSEHASNVGVMIAYSLSEDLGIPSFIYDGITVDELTPINKITGIPSISWKGMGHNLNTRAIAMCYAREQGRAYSDVTVIVAHLGGGMSVNMHHNGRIEDFINDENGSFTPERAGSLPMIDIIQLCYSGEYDYASLIKIIKHGGGLMAHLGTNDSQEVERMIAQGDEHAKLIYDAMALNVSKNIAKCAANVCGKVDAILLTGGIAYSDYVTRYIREHVEFIAPVVVYAGENEMRSLAQGGLRVLRGEEKVQIYTKVENPST